MFSKSTKLSKKNLIESKLASSVGMNDDLYEKFEKPAVTTLNF